MKKWERKSVRGKEGLSENFPKTLFIYLQQEHGNDAAKATNKESDDNLGKGVLAQNHTCRAKQSGQQEAEAEPSRRVETEDEGIGYKEAGDTTDGSHVCRDLPHHVYDDAYRLHYQRRNDDARDKMRYAHVAQNIVASNITGDGDGIRYHSLVTRTEIKGLPSMVMAVAEDHHRWQQDGEEIGGKQHVGDKAYRQHTQVAEREKQYQSYQRKVERCEDNAYRSCCYE